MKFLNDVYYAWIRRMRDILRHPTWIVNIIFQPLIWLILFTQLFSKIGTLPGFPASNYIDYFAPGIIVMLAIFGSIASGFGWLYDINFNFLEKELVTPVNRYALILGNALGWFLNLVMQIIVLIIIVLILGIHIVTGIYGIILTIIVVGLLGISLSCFGDAIVLKTHSQIPLVTLNTLISMPLMFLSTIMLPSSFVPSWVSIAAKFNPVDYAARAIRPLFLTGFNWSQIGISFIILSALMALSIVVATRALQKSN